MLLIHQLLAAIAEKGTSQAKTAEGENTKTEGKMATGTPDVPESSAQGDARGNHVSDVLIAFGASLKDIPMKNVLRSSLARYM
jgi:hypothetical protein